MRTFSNRYHFNGGTPSDPAHWTTLSDAIVTAEKACYCTPANGGATIVETVGYAAGSEVPVFTKTYATAGTLAWPGVNPAPGDVAALVRYSTGNRTTKNHPIYLMNYYHAVMPGGAIATSDQLVGTQATAFGTYATHWVTGFSDGANNYIRASPNGATALGSLVETLLTHRDLPR